MKAETGELIYRYVKAVDDIFRIWWGGAEKQKCEFWLKIFCKKKMVSTKVSQR